MSSVADAWNRASQTAVETDAVPVAKGYDLWAPSYDSSPNPLLALEERQLLPLLPDLTGKVVLDVACGTGRWLEKLLSRGTCSSVGVDLSSAMLEAARGKRGLRSCLIRADGLRLPLASEVVDFTLCSFAVAHFAELDPLARELARVTKPQAELFVSDVHPEAYAKGWQTAFRAGTAAVRITTFPHSVAEVGATFRTAGFELRQLIEAQLGEPERPIFVRAGKGDRFREACSIPAVLICSFRRKATEGERTT